MEADSKAGHALEPSNEMQSPPDCAAAREGDTVSKANAVIFHAVRPLSCLVGRLGAAVLVGEGITRIKVAKLEDFESNGGPRVCNRQGRQEATAMRFM